MLLKKNNFQIKAPGTKISYVESVSADEAPNTGSTIPIA